MEEMPQHHKKSETALREEAILAFWKTNRVFEKSLEKPSPKGEFVFYDGPPFATGLPHSGSMLSSIIKDVIPRYKTMRGYYVRRRWGWDTHGLPIENLVEKELGLKTKKDILEVGIEKFNETARSLVLRYVDDWREYVERVGRWVDYENSYKTMDNSYIESVWWAISEIDKKGLLYEGQKVLMYCTHCETPLAKAEIAADNTYRDVTEEATTVKFKIKNPSAKGMPENTFLLAWTTTPWTLPGNVALAVGRDIEYVASRWATKESDEFYVTAKNLVPPGLSAIAQIRGERLVGMEYEPLYEIPAVTAHKGKKHVVLDADFVSTDEGTGIVHTAVMYGEDDFNLGKSEGLPLVQLLKADGTYNDEAPEFARGKYIKEGERDIKRDLENRGLLFEKKNHTHSYPHCWRCGTPLIYNAVPSWFFNIQKVKELMVEENEKVTWEPAHLKEGRFRNILEGAPDWTISRNRFWATPLPIWKCDSCKAVKVIGSLDELADNAREDVPEHLDLHRPYVDQFTFLCSCGGIMRRIPEVVDCWVESGSMPFAEYHYPFENKEVFESRAPGDFIAEYIAQTRTWFYYLHAMGMLLFGRRAFNAVVSTGTILAADGSKMSKSKGNYTDPLHLLDQYGADAYRYYLMSSVVMQAEDFNFKDEDLKDAHNRVVGMLWNCYKFYELYKGEYDGVTLAAKSENPLDRWILARMAQLTAEVTEAFERLDVVRATRPLKQFADDYSTWYVRRSRERMKGPQMQSSLATQREVLLTLAKLIAPVMPFMAESLYKGASGPLESVHLEAWPELGQDETQDKEISLMKKTRDVVSKALEMRSSSKIRVRQPLKSLSIPRTWYLPEEREHLEIIKDEVNVKEIKLTDSQEMSLDTQLTPALKEEGFVRDLVRAGQGARKAAGLNPQDAIDLALDAPADAREIIGRFESELKSSLKAESVSFGELPGEKQLLGEFMIALAVSLR